MPVFTQPERHPAVTSAFSITVMVVDVWHFWLVFSHYLDSQRDGRRWLVSKCVPQVFTSTAFYCDMSNQKTFIQLLFGILIQEIERQSLEIIIRCNKNFSLITWCMIIMYLPDDTFPNHIFSYNQSWPILFPALIYYLIIILNNSQNTTSLLEYQKQCIKWIIEYPHLPILTTFLEIPSSSL